MLNRNFKDFKFRHKRNENQIIYTSKNIKDDNTLINQINHFADVVTKITKPKVNGNDGLVSLKILAAISKSSKIGKKIKI